MPEPGRCVGGFIPPNHQAMNQACMVFQTLLVLLEPSVGSLLASSDQTISHAHETLCVSKVPFGSEFQDAACAGHTLGIYAEAWHATNEGIEAKACVRRCGW